MQAFVRVNIISAVAQTALGAQQRTFACSAIVAQAVALGAQSLAAFCGSAGHHHIAPGCRGIDAIEPQSGKLAHESLALRRLGGRGNQHHAEFVGAAQRAVRMGELGIAGCVKCVCGGVVEYKATGGFEFGDSAFLIDHAQVDQRAFHHDIALRIRQDAGWCIGFRGDADKIFSLLQQNFLSARGGIKENVIVNAICNRAVRIDECRFLLRGRNLFHLDSSCCRNLCHRFCSRCPGGGGGLGWGRRAGLGLFLLLAHELLHVNMQLAAGIDVDAGVSQPYIAQVYQGGIGRVEKQPLICHGYGILCLRDFCAFCGGGLQIYAQGGQFCLYLGEALLPCFCRFAGIGVVGSVITGGSCEYRNGKCCNDGGFRHFFSSFFSLKSLAETVVTTGP